MPTIATCVMVLLMTFLGYAKNQDMDSTLIDTPYGPVNGLRTVNLQTGKEVFEFRGIQYGKAQRFKKPEMVEKWTDTIDATEFGAGCPQFVFEMAQDMGPPKMSEDCLFLNIYVPVNIKRNQMLPVMVWMHGGGLHLGFSNQYDGGWIATEGNVIVVTINYRLNIFGFLTLDHPAARGNYGLWDQKLALQWVQENIKAFGGDPQSVTIFGQSGGAWSTSVQALIPSNKGLFNRVIVQSGVISSSNFLTKKAIQDNIADLVNKTACSVDDMFKFVDCLREKPMKEIISLTDFYSDLPDDRLLFSTQYLPVVDGDLFPENPVDRLKDTNSEVYNFFISLDYLAGTMSNEGAFITMQLTPQILEYYNFNVSDGIPSKMVLKGMIDPFVEFYYNNDSDVKSKLYKFYMSEDQREQGLLASYLLSDIWFNFATLKMLEFHQSGNNGKTYQYVFSKPSDPPLFGQPPEWVKGVGHGEELRYMFDIGKIMPSLKGVIQLSDEEKLFSKRLIQYWSSFARTGQPTAVANEDSMSWRLFKVPERAYLDIDITDSVKTGWNRKMYELWSTFPPVNMVPDSSQTRDEL